MFESDMAAMLSAQIKNGCQYHDPCFSVFRNQIKCQRISVMNDLTQ